MSELEVEILQKSILVFLRIAIPPLLAWGLAEFRRWIELQRQRDYWYQVERAVSVAVTAAEQLDLDDALKQYGADKLEAAVALVEAQLAAWGVPLDVDQHLDAIRAMIESEVKRQFPKD